MTLVSFAGGLRSNRDHEQERIDLACAFRWTVRFNWHEAVSNHYSLAINDSGTQFLMNPNQVHFSRITASSLLLLDAEDPESVDRPDAPDPTAWGAAWCHTPACPPCTLRHACPFDLRDSAGLAC